MDKRLCSPFHSIVGGGNVDHLASAVRKGDQRRFCQKIEKEFQRLNGDIWACFEWGWRCLKAVRSLLMSGALYVESLRAKNNRFIDTFSCYGLYYSLYHCSSALLYLHPEVKMQKLHEIRHQYLLRSLKYKFVRNRVLPESYLTNLMKVKNMRELTTYFAPLGGLKASTYPDFQKIDKVFTESKKNASYAFQLCNVLGQIYWNVKDQCSEKNRGKCAILHKKESTRMLNRLHELLSYGWNVHGLQGMEDFDQIDAYVAGRWHLYELCPILNVDYVTTDTMEYFGETMPKAVEQEFIKFMSEIW